MEGRLRSDLVARLRETCASSRLVIAMGTSLSGVAADQIVTRVANRAADAKREAMRGSSRRLEAIDEGCDAPTTAAEPPAEAAAEAALGAVIINVQQTRLDGLACLRIFAKIDDVCRMLAKELRVDVPTAAAALAVREGQVRTTDVWELPYDPVSGEGLESAATGSRPLARLNLARGRRVRLAHCNPSTKEGIEGIVGPKTAQGHYTIDFEDGSHRVLGTWMLEAARVGELDRMPLVSV
jgi:hypothetical protein